MRKKTIIYGNRSLSKMLYLDALDSKEIEIIAFVVDEAYLDPSGFFSNCPQVSFEKVEQIYPPQDYSMIVLEGTLRELDSVSLYMKAKAKGYTLLNYFSPRAIIAESFSCGDNNVIFEMAYVGHHGKMGSNNILRQQVYCGHDFILGDNVIMNPGVKVGGFCHIESDVFIGMGATVINDLHLEKGCLIGAGSVCIRSTLPYTKNIGCPTQVIGTRYKQKEIPYV
jgi:acetyltransferase-like isoleucine patch superfamily enzyme